MQRSGLVTKHCLADFLSISSNLQHTTERFKWNARNRQTQELFSVSVDDITALGHMDFGINLRILDFRSDAEGAKQCTKIMCQNKEGFALPHSCSAVLHSPRSLLNLPVPRWPQIAWQYLNKTTEARNMQLLFRPTNYCNQVELQKAVFQYKQQ